MLRVVVVACSHRRRPVRRTQLAPASTSRQIHHPQRPHAAPSASSWTPTTSGATRPTATTPAMADAAGLGHGGERAKAHRLPTAPPFHQLLAPAPLSTAVRRRGNQRAAAPAAISPPSSFISSPRPFRPVVTMRILVIISHRRPRLGICLRRSRRPCRPRRRRPGAWRPTRWWRR